MMVSKQPPSAGTPQQSAKATSKTDLRIEEAVARLLAEAPPLSEGQRARLAELFAAARLDGHSNRRVGWATFLHRLSDVEYCGFVFVTCLAEKVSSPKDVVNRSQKAATEIPSTIATVRRPAFSSGKWAYKPVGAARIRDRTG